MTDVLTTVDMPKLMHRLMAKISPEPNSGCWLWIGSANSLGYGQICIGKGSKLYAAHRVTYEIMRGPIKSGLEMDHLCRVPCCVNPWHLEAVTHKENMRRSPTVGNGGGKHGRAKTHCPAGHPYDETNTYRAKSGGRICRECHRIDDRNRWKRRKGVAA